MLNPLVLVAVLAAGILICLLPRKYVIVPFLAAAFLIPMDQVFVAGPFHFYMLRVVIGFGWIRMLWTKTSSRCALFSGGINWIDTALIFYALFTAFNFILLWQQPDAVINQLGALYTILGIYVPLRFLIRDETDLERTLRVLAYIAAVVAMIMVYEQATGFNPYALLGGTREAIYQSLMERGNRFRAMGPFLHPILAGTFGAVLLPLFVGLWWKNHRSRFATMVGILSSTVITVASVSSTPALAYAAGVGALCLWPLRKHMRLIRWGIVVALVSLQMVMKAPVWALIARVDVIGGSSGYHRYMLVNQFIRRFDDWWLIGTKANGRWGWDMWDLANQYVSIGEVSGLLPLLMFLAIIVFGFRYLGTTRQSSEGNKRMELFIWAMCAALFSNAVAFFGISYFDQTQVAWYALLAMISTARFLAPSTSSMLVHSQTGVAQLFGTPPTRRAQHSVNTAGSYGRFGPF